MRYTMVVMDGLILVKKDRREAAVCLVKVWSCEFPTTGHVTITDLFAYKHPSDLGFITRGNQFNFT